MRRITVAYRGYFPHSPPPAIAGLHVLPPESGQRIGSALRDAALRHAIQGPDTAPQTVGHRRKPGAALQSASAAEGMLLTLIDALELLVWFGVLPAGTAAVAPSWPGTVPAGDGTGQRPGSHRVRHRRRGWPYLRPSPPRDRASLATREQ